MALNDITLGQYYPGDSAVHRLDPRVKILLLIALIVAISWRATCWPTCR